MRRAGKADAITIAITFLGIAGALALGILMLFSKESPQTACNRFLDALASGNVDTLVETSYYEGSKEDLRASWKYATDVGQHYLFHWETVSVKEHDENSAAVLSQIERNFGPSSYPEKIDIPMVKVDGRWKVDVRGLFRGLYPALPGNPNFAKYLETKKES